jgi:hypothetical protein
MGDMGEVEGDDEAATRSAPEESKLKGTVVHMLSLSVMNPPCGLLFFSCMRSLPFG